MFGPSTKLLKIRADQLQPHPLAQRDTVPSRLKKLVQNLDLDAIGVLHAVEYAINGEKGTWIIDGQRRVGILELDTLAQITKFNYSGDKP